MMLGNSDTSKLYYGAAEQHAAVGFGRGMDVEGYI